MVTMVPPDTGAREGEAGEGESSGSWGGRRKEVVEWDENFKRAEDH